MVKSNPDSLMLTLSKGLAQDNSHIFKITLKRGGVFKKEHTKSHSRKAKQALQQELKTEAMNDQDQHPLVVRTKIDN